MMNDIQNATELESETCSRCGGSGEFSYCSMYGRTCFKCRGRKRVYTKRGQAAALYLAQLRSKRADAFKPGDLVYMDGIPGFSKGKFYRVTGLSVHTAAEKIAKGHRSMTNGVEIPQRDSLRIEMDGYGWEGEPESMLRRGCTAEEKAETMRQALAYQATLTKQGKVAKRLAASAPLFCA